MSNGEFRDATKYFAFYSQTQQRFEECCYSRMKQDFENHYNNWKDQMIERTIEIFEENKSVVTQDILLESIYKNKPIFRPPTFINKKFKEVELTDFYSCQSYRNLDDLIKILKSTYPDIIYKGVVIEKYDSKIKKSARRISF